MSHVRKKGSPFRLRRATALRPGDFLPGTEARPLPVIPADVLLRFDRGDHGEEPIRRCAWCGHEIDLAARRGDSRYCSEPCSRSAENARHRAHRTAYARDWRRRRAAL